jgi:hypothetical protein
VPLFARPIGMELQNTTLHNGSSGSMRGVCHRDSFCRGFGRQHRSIGSIDHFDAKRFHWRISGCLPNESYGLVRRPSRLLILRLPSKQLGLSSAVSFSQSSW